MVMIINTDIIHTMTEGSQPIFSKSLWLYPPASIMGGIVPVAMGVRNAVVQAAFSRISGPTGLAPKDLQVRMTIGIKILLTL